MRYQVGQKVPFIHVGFNYHKDPDRPNHPRVVGMYIPWRDQLTSLTILHMIVKEHHKVPWDQDDSEELKYDGFIFDDHNGTIWNNQYPRASYGQTTDTADWIVKYPIESLEQYEQLKKDGRKVFYAQDLGKYLDTVLQGIREMADTPGSELECKAFEAHYDEIVAQYESSTGMKVV